MMDALHPGVVPMKKASAVALLLSCPSAQKRLCMHSTRGDEGTCKQHALLLTLRFLCCYITSTQVDYNAKNEYEYISNYKVLQEVFTKLNIDKVRVRCLCGLEDQPPMIV